MTSTKKVKINIILAVFLIVELILVGGFTARFLYARTIMHAATSYSQSSKEGNIMLCSVAAMKELAPEDALVKSIISEETNHHRYFLCTLEVENQNGQEERYPLLNAQNQDGDIIPCYGVDYYQGIEDEYVKTHVYNCEVIPEYSKGQQDVLLAIDDELVKKTKEITLYEWTYEKTEEDANGVSCLLEEAIKGSPIQ